MIKLMDLLLEVKLSPEEQEQYIQALAILQDKTLDEGIKDSLKKLGLTAAVIAALMASPQLSQAQKSIVSDLKSQITMVDTTRTGDIRTGTDVDGINGFFTSQFQFPTAFLKDLNSGKVTNLGYEGNEALQKVNESGISVQQMAQWNNFVKWMESKGYSGSKDMDNIEFSKKVLEEYKIVNPSFWVRSIYDKEGRNKDVEKVQAVIKAHRLYTIGIWKLGIDGALKQGFKPVSIEMGGVEMDPSSSEDVKRVNSNYMPWAK
jgi:cell division protein ZapA (FtsZ GTPase activity inhibitor)